MTATPPAVRKPAAAKTPAPLPAKPRAASPGFLSPGTGKESIADDATEEKRRKRMSRILTLQSIVLLVLSGILVMVLPFLQPIYQYAALSPGRQATPMAPLLLPNLTNRAIISWSATSVTEIMTIGFGDFQERILKQRQRFTKSGWEAFVHSFLNAKIDEAFKRNQLVLTTVPADTPIIVGQGPNEEGVYEWHVQIPVVMTYATNNNVTRPERGVVEITIARVPYEVSSSGIAIDTWHQMKGKGGGPSPGG